MYGTHIVNQIHKSDKMIDDNTLHVIRVISNPARFHSRYRLARLQEEFLKKCPNMKLYTVEAAYGKRSHELINDDPNNLKLRIKSEIWIKENMINLGIKHLLPKNWKYVAWIDGDVIWGGSYATNWATETIQQLQHYPILQPWEDGLDLGPYDNVMSHFKSFGAQHYLQFESAFMNRCQTKPKAEPASAMPSTDYRRWGHTGFAWACTRLMYENMPGGLMDFCILGSADHNMALACVSHVERSIHQKTTDGFKKKCMEWQEKVIRVTHNEIGSAKLRLEHFFHGPKRKRGYGNRWQLLIHYKFDPEKDLMYDDQGIIKLVGKPELEQAIKHYNRSRSEDSIEEG